MPQEVLFVLRQMRRSPALWTTAVLTLGLGLGAALAVFTLVNAMLLRPLPYPQSERLMAISRGATGSRQTVSHRDVEFLRAHVRTCSPIAAAVSGSGVNVTVGGITSYQQDLLVSHGFFAALGVSPAWGRGFTPDEDTQDPAPVVVLNERFVRAQGLDPEHLPGSTMELAGTTHTVIGVLAARHTRPSDPDLYRPLGRDARGNGQNLAVLCRLAADATADAVNAELGLLLDEARRQRLFGERATASYSAMTRHEWEFGTYRPQLRTLLAAVALVLMAAAANAAGLLLVRAAGRRREMAVRTALGASPRRLARSLLVEGFTLAALGGVIGLAAAPLFISGLLAAAPANYAGLASFDPDRVVLGMTVALCTVVGALVTLPPLAEILRVNLRDSLQEEGRSGTQSRRTLWMRHALIAAETAVCTVLLVGALLLLRTFVNLMQVETGVDSRGVITARMSVQGPEYEDPAQLVRFFEQGLARLAASPQIQLAAVGATLPAERALNLPAAFLDGARPDQEEIVNWRYASPEYFPLLGMRAVAGRLFGDTDRPGAAPVTVVNESFARQVYGGIDQALGRRISVWDHPAREIVGVVSDTSGWSLADAPRPIMFVPLAQVEPALIRVAHAYFPPRWLVRARDPEGARRLLQQVGRELDPRQPFIDIRSLDDRMIASVGLQRFYLAVLSAFALFSVVLAAVGIYATYSYAVTSRTSEIGVRLALGAAPRDVLLGVIGRALLAGGAATAVGLAVALAGTRLLGSLLFGVTATDPASYAAVAALMLLTVAGATALPASRAARIDPLVAMRGS